MTRATPLLLSLILIIGLAQAPLATPASGDNVLELAYSQVFMVVCNDNIGTAWFVNPSYAVTAYHVVSGCTSIQGIRGPWQSQLTVVYRDTELDLAILRVESPPDWARGLPLAFKVSIGDKVFVVGYPVTLIAEVGDLGAASNNPRVAEAVVAWFHPSKPILEFQGPTDAGNSGGPLVSERLGGVVGIVLYAREGVVSESFYALRMDAVARALDQAGIEYEVVGDPWELALAILVLGVGLVSAVMLLASVRRG